MAQSLTQSMAIEFAQYGITVNEMIPGPVKANVPEGEKFEPYIVKEGLGKTNGSRALRMLFPWLYFWHLNTSAGHRARASL